MTSENMVKELVLAGKSVKDISQEVNVSVQYVYKVINKNNMKGNVIHKNKLIMEMIYDGISDKDISEQLSVSRSTIYRAKRKEAVNAHESDSKLTSWSIKTFNIIQDVSNKYRRILSMKGIYIDFQEIESVLLDLMIHTDQKDIKNKDAYFRKYCPFKIKNLCSKLINHKTDSMSDDDLMDRICINDLDPEKILLIKEMCVGNAW